MQRCALMYTRCVGYTDTPPQTSGDGLPLRVDETHTAGERYRQDATIRAGTDWRCGRSEGQNLA